MMRRLAALLVVVAITAGPLPLEVCQIACATSASHSMTMDMPQGAMHHRGMSQPCHESGPAWSASAMCDHDGGLTSPSVVVSRADIVVPPPMRAVGFDLPGTLRAAFRDRGRGLPLFDRLELRSFLPLRI